MNLTLLKLENGGTNALLGESDRAVVVKALETLSNNDAERFFGFSINTLKKAANGLPVRDASARAISVRIAERSHCLQCQTSHKLSPQQVLETEPYVCQPCTEKPLPVYTPDGRGLSISGGGANCNITFATKKRRRP